MTSPALQLGAVSSGYGASVVLRDLSLAVAPGEAVVLLGKNGMGKTTLLKTVMGYLPKKSGRVQLNGRDITRHGPHEVARLGVAYASQEQAIFTELSVRDNLQLGLAKAAGFDERFAAVEPLFPAFKDRLRQPAGTLSGGEQKMLLVARGLMQRPAIMLLDEVTEGLQPTVIERIQHALVQQRADHGTTMLLVEQHVPFALRVADRYVLLKQGEVVDAGDTRQPGANDLIFEHLRV